MLSRHPGSGCSTIRDACAAAVAAFDRAPADADAAASACGVGHVENLSCVCTCRAIAGKRAAEPLLLSAEGLTTADLGACGLARANETLASSWRKRGYESRGSGPDAHEVKARRASASVYVCDKRRWSPLRWAERSKEGYRAGHAKACRPATRRAYVGDPVSCAPDRAGGSLRRTRGIQPCSSGAHTRRRARAGACSTLRRSRAARRAPMPAQPRERRRCRADAHRRRVQRWRWRRCGRSLRRWRSERTHQDDMHLAHPNGEA